MKELHRKHPAVREFIAKAIHRHERDPRHDAETTVYGDGTRVLKLITIRGRQIAQLWEPGDDMPFGGKFQYEDFFLPEEIA